MPAEKANRENLLRTSLQRGSQAMLTGSAIQDDLWPGGGETHSFWEQGCQRVGSLSKMSQLGKSNNPKAKY